jgi:signal transduction histidine kinase
MTPDEAREEQVRRSRAGVVAAADADRRRIERELHDGPQQRLVALAMELQQARLLARESDYPAELSELIERLAADVRSALAELRELAARIHPPLLVGHGLAASLRPAVAPAVVEVEGEPLGSLPDAAAVAVYLSCLDAVEHAGADVRILLERNENGVHFTITGEGAGIDPARVDRIADRVSGLGGSLSFEATRLTAEIPLERS